VATALLAGVASWSLAEYLIHRGLGHVFVRSRNPFTTEHRKHHATTSYFSPSRKKTIAAVGTMVVVAPLAMALVGVAGGGAYGIGSVAMYVTYEVVHRRAHTHGPRGRYGRWLRRHHFTHHFLAPHKNHGVTSPLWDVVFGTYQRATVVRVPARHAMPWLLDRVTGAVRLEYAADYVLHERSTGPPAG
jgi:hypothetical protein